ncbi:MAG: sigma-54 dependent transcriptional regulator [Candidatus Eisenbacteria bacterium]
MERSNRILVLDDEPLVGDFLRTYLERKGQEVRVASGPEEALEHLRSGAYDVLFLDHRDGGGRFRPFLRSVAEAAPDTRIVVLSARPSVEGAVEAMRLGAADLLTKPFGGEEIDRVLDRVAENRPLPSAGAAPDSEEGGQSLVGESRPMQEVRHLIRIAASTDATVLVSGETGTGKELVARAIHLRSRRSRAHFIRFNCAALTETLYESELFGHERGAFTGAVRQKKGRFELAHRGTLLMDEISEISWGAQAKLLRVLQEKELERVGGCATIRIDTRVIATTNKDLAREIRAERFRPDLYYRLSVFPIAVGPLRERKSDIPLLADHFLRLHCDRNGIGALEIGPSAMDLLTHHRWPGNVRQLENSLERAVLVCTGRVIGPEHLPDLVEERKVAVASPSGAEEVVTSGMTLREAETALLIQALEESDGNRTAAAEKLGITTRTLRNKLHRLGMMDYMKPGDENGKEIPPGGEKETGPHPVPAGLSHGGDPSK